MNNLKSQLDTIKQNYKAYIELYKEFNNGSTEGITPFDEFYWRFTYYVKYADLSVVGICDL